jgi:hypothetical protein
MKKLLTVVALLLAFASASFGQSLVADAKPTCGTPQIGAYGSYEVLPTEDTGSGFAGLNLVPLGFRLCGTYTKITVEVKTATPSDKSDGVIFGIFDKTTNTYMTCALYVGDTSCNLIGSAVYNGISWSYPSTGSFTFGDEIYFQVYIAGASHTAYTIQNITWRLE